MNMLSLFVVLLISCTIGAYDRNIHSEINPGCKSCNDTSVILIYVRSDGERDTIHNLWDFTNGKPTIILAITDLNATLNTKWDSANKKPVEIGFSETPKYSFGVIFDKLWEFDDINDTAIFNKNATPNHCFNTQYMLWERSELVLEESQAMVKVALHSFKNNRRKGDIIVKFDLYPFTSYAYDLPHLVHSANSSLIDIVLKNVSTSQNFNNSRFAIELMVISTEKNNDTMRLNLRKGLDDEHTPGVFEIIELITPETFKNSDGGFLQYRPVSYIHPHRDVASSTKVNTGPLTPTNIPENTTAYIYFNILKKTFNILTESVIISLGDKSDGFYKKSHYNIWSFTAGYGKPPAEGFSLLVILILSIGLGIPMILIISGAIYICTKRYKRRANRHARLES